MFAHRHLLRSAAHLILLKKGEVLLARRFNTGWEDGQFSVIAGHLDGGETVTECMIREAREEAGLQLTKEHLTVVHTMHRLSGDVEYIDFFLAASSWEGTPTIMEPNKCDMLEWFPEDSLPHNVVPYVAQAIAHIMHGVSFSEFGWDGRQ